MEVRPGITHSRIRHKKSLNSDSIRDCKQDKNVQYLFGEINSSFIGTKSVFYYHTLYDFNRKSNGATSTRTKGSRENHFSIPETAIKEISIKRVVVSSVRTYCVLKGFVRGVRVRTHRNNMILSSLSVLLRRKLFSWFLGPVRRRYG